MPNELLIRLSVFLALFLGFALLERILPKRPRQLSSSGRWITNLSMTVLNTFALRALSILMPFLAVGAAIDAWSAGWGLLNSVVWPFWAEVALTLLVLDFAMWLQHFVTHRVPLLWRFHRVHHADRDMDVTTGLRFHPVEILVSMIFKIGLIYLLGPQAFAVVLFEVLLNATALFNHSNLRLPVWLDRVVRLVIVTPDMHRVHHSTLRSEHDTNFGFALSIWDRLFRTYTAQPLHGHIEMTVGLEWQGKEPSHLWWSLLLPFRK